MKKIAVLKFKVENVMNRSLFLFVVFLQLFVSCNKSSESSDIESECLVVYDRNLANQLKSSPENVVINGNRYNLFTYLWRDFMPGAAGPDGSPLMCVIKIKGHNGGNILHNTTSLSRIYVINNHQIWISDTFDTHIFNDDNWEVVIRNGPKWGPNATVDVICEFKNSGKTYRLMSKSQIINVTY